MAEILGLASSIITIVEVAGKLGTSIIRLKRLWDEVQDVPASIQRCIEQLEILAPAIEEMDHEFEKTRNMIRNDSAAKRSLEYSRKAVETLDTLVRDMETQISAVKASRRLIAISYQQIETIKPLILMGMRISDVDSSDLFFYICLWLWKDPQAEGPIEIAHEWTKEIEGILSEGLEGRHFRAAFWRVPNVYTLLSETGSVRQVLPSFDWIDVNPAVPLELIKSGLARISDFRPIYCTTRPDGTCDCYDSNLIFQYFHALLNNDKGFHDWRCLARKALLGVSPLDIVHPHDGAFWNLTSTLAALWKRQFRLLPFERWIQNAVTLWLEDVAAAGINLVEYMSLELLYSQDLQRDAACQDTKMEFRLGAHLPESGPSLVILSVGPRADDWSFSWDPCVEELSGEFWTALEDSRIKVPGAWVDERTEDFECLMGNPTACWFRRQERYYKNKSNMATNEIPKEMHMQAMRLQGAQWPEIKYREGLRVRGMTTCEEFSPYKAWFWI
ncbi:hypothetical protein J7337_007278 [Fusarium musae]|uniref:NACHT-NTPase and P-loop NTPases N-terminal domain-containing protein n=1 Tax=Fusarium musae TaxID=1042133 RepID=A0A9P8DGK8_9HYPO|nr:hypothetical protein J7337_007278 [Fusarium musae]KAG9501587.1 hypothetical protein J7337_007278 [Fusarium musae]